MCNSLNRQETVGILRCAQDDGRFIFSTPAQEREPKGH